MNPENIVCEVCGAVVARNKYERHIRYGHKERRENKCHLCQKQFTSLYNLQYHIAHHNNARSFLCNECPRAYNTAADLAQHQRIHEKQRDPYRCFQCGLFFQIRSKFNTHLRTHASTSVKGPKECLICNKSFVCLSSHNRTVHLALRQHECNECGKTFGKKSGLDRHVLTVHEKIKAFKCDFEGCRGQFGEKSQLKKHLKTHSDRDQSFCNFCKMNFDDIKSHYDSIHPESKHHCKICFKRFSKLTSLKLHVKVFHTKERNFFCDLCPDVKGFADKSQLKRHLRRHKDCSKVSDDDEVFEFSSDFGMSTNLKPEEVYVTTEDHKSDPTEQVDVLVEIKSEVLSDEEDGVELKLEPEVVVKMEQDDICVDSGASFFKHDSRNKRDQFNLELRLSHEPPKQEDEGDCCPCGVEFSCKDERQKHFNEQHLTEMESNWDLQFSESDYFDNNSNQCGRNFQNKSALDVHEIRNNVSFELKHDLRHHHDATQDGSRPAQKTCPICGKTFSKHRNLQIHILAIHNEKAFECEICAKKFSFKSAKERHVKVVHLNQRCHQCNYCQKYFGTKADLRNHIAFHHSLDPEEIGQYYCSLCEKSFTSSSALKRHHKGVHENIKQQRPRDYRCKYCREVLTNKYQKEKHVAQVHQDGLKLLRTCLLCNLDFQLFTDFKQHIDSHQGSHICMICGIGNADGAALTSHMDSHKHIEMKLRRFSCDSCGHKLFNKIQLRVHMRKHMKETNFYVCDICGQSYKYIAPFLYHKKVHEGKKDFVCTHCGKDFMRKQDLVIHTRSHTQEKPFKCTECDKRFAARQILQVHLQTHSTTRKVFSCIECNLSFADKCQARYHDEKVHPDRRPFWCCHCKKSFKLEHLLKIHVKHKHKTDEIANVTNDLWTQ